MTVNEYGAMFLKCLITLLKSQYSISIKIIQIKESKLT